MSALWTAEEDAKLKQMLADGCSFLRIGAALGRSRNAVVGYIDRNRAKFGFPDSTKFKVRGGFSSIKKSRASYSPETVPDFPTAPGHKTAGHARREMGSNGANIGGENVASSAERARRAGEPTYALTGQVETRVRDEFVERTTSGPDDKRASQSGGSAFAAVKAKSRLANAAGVEPLPSETNSPSLPISSPAVKPEAVPPPPAVSGEIRPAYGVSLMNLGWRNCRYVIAGEGANALFCGDETISPSCSWCAHHRALVPAPRVAVEKAREAVAA